ncbi:MAG: alpha/beta hydrolase family esterase [Myxococcota bacterium]
MPRVRARDLRVAPALCLGLTLLASPACASDQLHTISVAGVERSYVLHVPPPAVSGAPLPLVLVLHGAGGNGRIIAQQSGFSEEADWRGFVAVYPNGSHGAVASAFAFGQPRFLVWNAGLCCGWAAEQRIDDVGFMRALVAEVSRRVAIDPRRVYAAGMSNGGMMAYRLACEASDVFAAVAVVSGALVAPGCAPSQPVSVIHFHGTADDIVPIEGGRGILTPPGRGYPSAESAIAFWRAANGCDPAARDSAPRSGVRRTRYTGCHEGSGVDYFVIDGGKHAWPGGDRISVILPPVSPAISATPAIWEFLASHPKPER